MNRRRGFGNKDGSSGLDVLVIGVGGGGNNSINRLSRIGAYGAKTIAVNTDREHLKSITADTKMLIGKEYNKGLGTGGNPNVGMQCAESAYGGFKKLLKDTELVFITAGMGGGTGTGAAPVIAEIARKQKAMVISIATMPFSIEGNRRETAIRGVSRLREYSNSMILLENDKLLEVVPDLPMDQAFGIMDSLISELIKSVTEIITLPSLINLDYNDLKSVLGNGGVSTMMVGESTFDEPKKAVEEASKNPFLNVDYTGAKKALIHVTGGPNLSISKMNDVVDMMTSKLDPKAGVIFGARIDEECQNRIKLMSIVTGLNKGQKNKIKTIA